MRKFLNHAGEAIAFGAFTVGLGVLLCLFIDVSIVWCPLLGPLGVYGLCKAARFF